MTHETFAFRSRVDGNPLSAMMTLPDGQPRAVVQIAHGMAEHKERYQGLMEALAEAGIASFIHDHRGHGASVHGERDLGHMGAGGGEALVADLFQMTEETRALLPGVPLVLLGHSMGTLAARCYARQDDSGLSGLILVGSPVKNPAAPAGHAVVKSMARIRGDRHVSPLVIKLVSGATEGQFPGEGRNAWLSSAPENVRAYDDDPLCGFPFTLSGYDGLLTLMRGAYAERGWKAENRALPVLLLSGRDDPCMVNEQRLQEAADHLRGQGYRDVAVKTYPGMRHEVLLERGREQVFSDVIAHVERSIR